MTATNSVSNQSDRDRFAKFHVAEQAVWDLYGLTPQERFVDLGRNIALRVNDVGEGDPIVFVHGTGGSGVYFAPLVKELAPRYRWFAP